MQQLRSRHATALIPPTLNPTHNQVFLSHSQWPAAKRRVAQLQPKQAAMLDMGHAHECRGWLGTPN